MLKQRVSPDIWVAAGDGCSFLEKFDYVLTELPSQGKSFSPADLREIEVFVTCRDL
jgi:hypothetical protein